MFGLSKKFNISIYFNKDEKLVLELSYDKNNKKIHISKYDFSQIIGTNNDILLKTGNYNQLDANKKAEYKNKISQISFYKMNIEKKNKFKIHLIYQLILIRRLYLIVRGDYNLILFVRKNCF